jgi:hypothetical protein
MRCFYKFLPFGELVLATSQWDMTTSATYGKPEKIFGMHNREAKQAPAGSPLSKNQALSHMLKTTLAEGL